jgi:hypothetical protein
LYRSTAIYKRLDNGVALPPSFLTNTYPEAVSFTTAKATVISPLSGPDIAFLGMLDKYENDGSSVDGPYARTGFIVVRAAMAAADRSVLIRIAVSPFIGVALRIHTRAVEPTNRAIQRVSA